MWLYYSHLPKKISQRFPTPPFHLFVLIVFNILPSREESFYYKPLCFSTLLSTKKSFYPENQEQKF